MIHRHLPVNSLAPIASASLPVQHLAHRRPLLRGESTAPSWQVLSSVDGGTSRSSRASGMTYGLKLCWPQHLSTSLRFLSLLHVFGGCISLLCFRKAAFCLLQVSAGVDIWRTWQATTVTHFFHFVLKRYGDSLCWWAVRWDVRMAMRRSPPPQ